MGLFYDDDDDDECGTVTGVIIGKSSINTRRKPRPSASFVHHKSHMI
jgi:hypothetical protein